MRIDRINIDGFGVFHDKNVNGFKKGVNVLYGPNEAGKSTLLDFIRFTLFEYPRFKDERRPPLDGGKHGGRLFFKDSTGQNFSIYRNGNGKDVGFEQNGQETENLQTYRGLIGNASIDLYKNVYAVTLDELLHVNQLSDSGMEDRIFSMGMGLAGVDFGKFEKGLISHSESYFKTRGSTQVLVQLVDQIREKEASILALRNKLGEYDRLSAQKEELENTLAEVQRSREELSAAKNKYADYSRAYEPYVAHTVAEKELKNLGEIAPFPAKLEEDFEDCDNRSKTIKSELTKAKQFADQLKDELANINWNKELAEHIHLIDFFKTNVKLYEEARSSIDQSKDRLKSANNSSEQILQKLGSGVNQEQLLSIEGTFELRSEATELVDKKQSLQRQLDTNEEQSRQAQKEAEQLKEHKQRGEDELKKVAIKNDQDRQQAESRRIELDTAFQKALQGTGISQQSSNTPLILSLLFLVAGGVLFAINTMAAGIVLGLAVLSLIFVLVTKQKGGTTSERVDANSINKEIGSLKSDIEKYDEFKKNHDQVVQDLIRLEKDLEVIIAAQHKLNESLLQMDDQWSDKLKKKGLPEDLPAQRVGDFLTNVNELKRLHQDIIESKRSIQSTEERIQQFEDKLRSVLSGHDSFESSTIYELINSLEAESKAAQNRVQLEDQLKKKVHELETLNSSATQIEQERKGLLEQAKVETSEAFYIAIEHQKLYDDLKRKQENAGTTIKTICGADELEKTLKELEQFTPSELSTKKENTEIDYESVKEQYDQMNRELASIKTEIRHILEPDEMYGLQNEKESLQERLKEETKEWLSTKLALEVLNESKQRYEQERQPEVITQTRKYFKAITENAYEDLRISLSEKHVSIIDDRGRHKTVEELSRGTREQLLLALRLGLIEEYEKNAEPLPVALDDIMVNFDVHRAENLAKVLTDFAKDRQVILFTCHEHTRDLFKDEGATIIDW